jgi:hypothetical protein
MESLDQQRFTLDVIRDANRIEFIDVLGDAREALSFGGGVAQPGDTERAELQRAKIEAESLVRSPTILQRLCPALRSVSTDLDTVAGTVASVLLPLAVGPQALVPLSSLVFGAVAVIAVRAGVRTICPEEPHWSRLRAMGQASVELLGRLQKAAYARLGASAPNFSQDRDRMLRWKDESLEQLRDGGPYDLALKQRFEAEGLDPALRFSKLKQMREAVEQTELDPENETVG